MGISKQGKSMNQNSACTLKYLHEIHIQSSFGFLKICKESPCSSNNRQTKGYTRKLHEPEYQRIDTQGVIRKHLHKLSSTNLESSRATWKGEEKTPIEEYHQIFQVRGVEKSNNFNIGKAWPRNN